MAKAAFNLTARLNMAGPYYLTKVVSKIKQELKGIKPELKLDIAKGTSGKVRAVKIQLDALNKSATAANVSVKKLNVSLGNVSTSLREIAIATSKLATSTNSMSQSVNKTNKATQNATTVTAGFGKEAARAIRHFAAFTSVTAGVYTLTNAIKQGYNEFVTFNSELVKLSQVTNQSIGELQGIQKEITRLSVSLGVSSQDLIVVSTTLAQAGFSANETKVALEALAKSTLAPSFENITDTTQGAIAAFRQFGIASSDLEGILGSINAVAAAFAVESGDIISAIQRTGGVFASASRGVSEGTQALNEFIAIFTSVRQTTRESAETIATGLRTIFTRIQRSATIKLLEQYGVQLRDTEGKFVGAYEAARRLSEGLRSIDPRSADFAAISEELGGFRQIGKVIPLLQQFGVAQQAYNVAVKGAGSLSEDALTSQQKLAIQFEKTRQNFLSLIREIGDSTSFRAFVGSVLSLTNGLIELGRALKPLLPSLALLGTLKLAQAAPLFAAGAAGAFGGRRRNNGGPIRKFATGGMVPGVGNTDSVKAMLQPGEFVIRKRAVQTLGTDNLTQLNKSNGGYIPQKFAIGGSVLREKKSREDRILENVTIGQTKGGRDIYEFGVAALRAGAGKKSDVSFFGKEDGSQSASQVSSSLLKPFSIPSSTPKGKKRIGVFRVGTLNASGLDTTIEEQLKSGFHETVTKVGQTLSAKANTTPTTNQTTLNKIYSGSGFQSVIGSGLEAAIAMVGGPYISKTEKTKSFDFPLGLGSAAAQLFNIPPNIPTDATRTIGGFGKSRNKLIASARRFVKAIDGGEFTDARKTKVNAYLSNKPGAANKTSGILSLLSSKIQGTTSQAPVTSRELAQKFNAIAAQQYPQSFLIAGRQVQLSSKEINRAINKQDLSSIEKRFGDTSTFEAIAKQLAKGGSVNKFALGGNVNADSVPALLTPGEFVINKKSANSIGQHNLHRLNKADKLPGFNKGGLVGGQRFARGGNVQGNDLLLYGGAAAIFGIITDQIRKFSETLKNVNGPLQDFGIGIGQFVESGLSKGIAATAAARLVGIDKNRAASLGLGAGLAGGVAGTISEITAKKLEKALSNNTKQFTKVENNLKDITDASTSEARTEAVQRLEESFFALDTSVRASASSISQLQNIETLSQVVDSSTTTIISSITAFSLLSNTASKASRVVGLLGSTAKFSTRILAGLSPFIGWIGLAVTAGSVLINVFSALSSTSNKMDDILDRLNKNLDETVKNSEAFNVANRSFALNVLPGFRKILEDAAQTNDPQSTIQARLSQERLASGGLSRFDPRFRIRLQSQLSQRGLGINKSETLEQAASRLRSAGLGQIFNEALKSTEEYAAKQDYISSLVEKDGLSRSDAEAKYIKVMREDASIVKRIAQEYSDAKNIELLRTRSLSDSFNSLKTNVVALEAVLKTYTSKIDRSLSTIELNLQNLSNYRDFITGESKITPNELPKRDIAILQNISSSNDRDLRDVLTNFGRNIGLSSEQQNADINNTFLGNNTGQAIQSFQQISKDISTLSVLEKELPAALGAIQTNNLEVENILNKYLGKSLSNIDSGQSKEIIRELSASITEARASNKGAILTVPDLVSNSKEFKTIYDRLNASKDVILTVNQKSLEFEKLIYEQRQKSYDIQNKILQSEITRLQESNRWQESINQIFSIPTSYAERLSVFNDELISRTRGIGANLPPGQQLNAGTSNAQTIIDTKNALLATISSLQKQKSAIDISSTQYSTLSSQIAASEADYSKLRDTLDRVVQSGDNVQMAFDELSKFADQFKTQEQIAIEILRDSLDPKKAFEIEQRIDRLGRVLSGRGTAFDALESYGDRLVSFFPNADQINQAIFSQLATKGGDSSGAQIFRKWLTDNLFKLGQKTVEVNNQLESVNNARLNIEQDFNQSLIRTNAEIDSSFKTFSQSVQSFGAAAMNYRDLQAIATQQNAEISKPISVTQTKTFADLLLSINATVNRLDTNINYPGPGGVKYTSIKQNVLPASLRDELSQEIARLQTQGLSLQDIYKGRIDQTGNLLPGQPEPKLRTIITEAFTNASQSGLPNKELLSTLIQLKEVIANIRLFEQNRLAPPPQTNTTPAGVPAARSVTPQQLGFNSQPFENLSKSLNDSQNNINSLAASIDKFTPTASKLSEAIEKLVNNFPDGVLRTSIDQTADVNISFNESLNVAATEQLGNRAARDIESIVQRQIAVAIDPIIKTLRNA